MSIFECIEDNEKTKFASNYGLGFLGTQYFSESWESFWVHEEGTGVNIDDIEEKIYLTAVEEDRESAVRKIQLTKSKLESFMGELDELVLLDDIRPLG